MKRLRVKKQFGEWLYVKTMTDDLDAPIYDLYMVTEEGYKFVNEFGSYGDMKTFVETGKML